MFGQGLDAMGRWAYIIQRGKSGYMAKWKILVGKSIAKRLEPNLGSVSDPVIYLSYDLNIYI